MKCAEIMLVEGLLLLSITSVGLAGNIDPYDEGSKYAYGENMGWLNFDPNTGAGVTVSDIQLTGYVWGENIGWINLNPNDFDSDTGITNDGTGLLSGMAWGENVGWINFNPKVSGDDNHYGVIIDGQGNFDGWAWGENIGWIHFKSETPVAYKVHTVWATSCIVDLMDLCELAACWLATDEHLVLDADLDDSGTVDLEDFSIVADYWMLQCPPGWPLK